MNTTARTLLTVLAASALAVAAVPAEAGGRHGGSGAYRGGHAGHGGWGWSRPVVGVGIGIGLGAYYGGYWGPGYGVYLPYGYAPGVVVVDASAPAATYATPPTQPAARSGPPDPVIYPRNGQSPAQTETDVQECNRWATTQQAAMADASVFQRAVAACMDARGYTLR